MSATAEKTPVATEWSPADIFRDGRRSPFVLLVLNQPLNHMGVIRRLWKNGRPQPVSRSDNMPLPVL
jgi:hypothetical protein